MGCLSDDGGMAASHSQPQHILLSDMHFQRCMCSQASVFCNKPHPLLFTALSALSGQLGCLSTPEHPRMSKTRPKIMDALDAVSDDSDADSSSEEPEQEAPQTAPAKKQKTEITIEDLQKQGYQGGPSVLYMKPPEEAGQQDWNWGNGKAQKSQEAAEESYEERQRTHAAATTATEESARLALKAQEHAARLREEARKEREELAAKNRLSFSQKEKRKRDAGQQSKGKSTVEEEKRIARQFGVYSGFD